MNENIKYPAAYVLPAAEDDVQVVLTRTQMKEIDDKFSSLTAERDAAVDSYRRITSTADEVHRKIAALAAELAETRRLIAEFAEAISQTVSYVLAKRRGDSNRGNATTIYNRNRLAFSALLAYAAKHATEPEPAACPNCGGTEHIPPLPGTLGRRCVKCCGEAANTEGKAE